MSTRTPSLGSPLQLAVAGFVACLFIANQPDCYAVEDSQSTLQLQRLRQQRKQAACAKRRLLYNNDGNSIVYKLKDKVISAETLLADRTAGLIGTHVDTIFYCTWSTGLGQFTHISPVAEPFVATTGAFKENRTAEFHAKGLDPLQVMVEFGERIWGPAWTRMFGTLGSNPWAAMPSLHFATALMAAILLSDSGGRLQGTLGWGYAAALGFSLVYLGEHYVTDLLAGAGLVLLVRQGEPLARPLVNGVNNGLRRLERIATS